MNTYLTLLCIIAAPEFLLAKSACPRGYQYFDHTSKCYKVFNPRSWRDARTLCQSEGGQLASVPDVQTNEFLASIITRYTWIGGYRLKDNKNVWAWTDGSKWGHENWGSGQPNNYGGKQNYVAMRGSGQWDDIMDDKPHQFICQKASELLECCGRANLNRIVGGVDTNSNEYPWHVGIVKGNNKKPSCGGAIISNRHILTAAHCTINDQKSNIKVLLGEHDLTDDIADIRTISNKEEHPMYNDENPVVYDVSILTLSYPITFSTTMSPVCLPTNPSDLYVGKTATVTGWGKSYTLKDTETSTDWNKPLKALKEVDLTVLKNSDCKNLYNKLPKFKRDGIIDVHLCASAPGKDACGGDSGGPLFTMENGRSTQIGVVSFGPGDCASKKAPGVFVRVTSSVKDWILENSSGSKNSDCTDN